MTTSTSRPRARCTSDALPGKFLGAVNTPVFRASTMLFPTVAELEQAARGEYEGIGYGLHGLPTVTDLQDTVAAIEGAHAALAVPSGLTATTLPLLALLKAGDHVLVTDAVYGPTRRFCNNHLTRLGVEVSYYDPLLGAAIEREFRPNTRIVFTESPGSLTFCVQDIPAIAAVAHRRGALVITDNSWATPFGFRSFDHGVDVSVHAATKYIGGHSDVLSGLILASEATFPALHRLWTDMGVTASPDDCFLALRGLRTLPLRLARHVESALKIAQWLQDATRSARSDLPGASGLARPRVVEARLHRRIGTFRGRARAGGQGARRRDARPHAPVRNGLELGRIREPDHSDLSGARADRHDVGRRRAVPAPRHRARGSRTI